MRDPPEIYLLIFWYLPPELIVAFALTCRESYRRWMPARLSGSKSERETLLCWLEKDMPKLYFCHRCGDLHTWREAPIIKGIPRYDKHCRHREWTHAPVLSHLSYEVQRRHDWP